MGREVHLVNSITESIENETISWQSEPESEIANSGEVRFADAPAGPRHLCHPDPCLRSPARESLGASARSCSSASPRCRRAAIFTASSS